MKGARPAKPSAGPVRRLAKADAMRPGFEHSTPRLVECPNCGGCATIISLGRIGCERLTCLCGARRESKLDLLVGYTPWLRVETRWGNLMAWNHEHLALLRTLIEAKLRERAPDPKLGWNNRSQLSRLPAWAKSRKNRTEILRAIDRVMAEELAQRPRARRDRYPPWEEVQRQVTRRVAHDLRGGARPKRYEPRRP